MPALTIPIDPMLRDATILRAPLAGANSNLRAASEALKVKAITWAQALECIRVNQKTEPERVE
ncbi:hypothetical protein V565_325620, partial [Rhizoctonia solani 123E]